ncbi:glycoside hydrolase superfamily [Aspergillus pseudodeflectus]|uniref:beta-glucosidase n=1 Tax=Aspergillus pseudodeflectus TaxID=176178 RepID=A0ABR4K515_9EURO
MAATSISSTGWKSLIPQLTLEEKCSLLAGADFWQTTAIERLGIPSLKMSDGPNGARGEGFYGSKTSACFPASVSLAATWDAGLVHAVGHALAEDTKSKGARLLLGPTVCPHRHPLGGRNFESFSEDPFLAGSLAAEYIKGLQGNGIGAVIKHYAANEQETLRNTIDVWVSERALREIYLRPFEIAIKESKPLGVMTAYNSVNGAHADFNEFLLKKVLRAEWGFKGLVMSDWGGTNSTAASLNAGLDLEMPGPSTHRTLPLVQKALDGELTMETIDERVSNVLECLSRTGCFENPTAVLEEQAIDLPEHRALIRRAGADGIVLLKNTDNILPLQPGHHKAIALVGLAKEYLGHGGGSAAVNSHHKVTPFDALTEALGDSCELRYAEGARILRSLSPLSADVTTQNGQPGFEVEITFADSTPRKSLVSPCSRFIHFELRNIESAVMTGIYMPTESGAHYISFNVFGEATISINGRVVLRRENSRDLMATLVGYGAPVTIQHEFVQGREYEIRISAKACECFDGGVCDMGTAYLGFSLGLAHQSEYEADLLGPAVEAARSSDIALVFTGHTPAWETEGADRESFALPKDGSQDRLIEAVAAVNRNTIVVNCTGSPIDMPWASQVAAIVQAWFPGQEAGYSIADVLLGKVNPGGKLPTTLPKSLDDSAANSHFPGDVESRVVEYKEDIFVGYRHHDRFPEGVLFPFGFGLSYTTFEIDPVSIQLSTDVVSGPESTMNIRIKVKNTGAVCGSEVVQIYVGYLGDNPTVERPQKELCGFGKVEVDRGREEWINITVSARSLAYWNDKRKLWSIDGGKYTLYIAASSTDIRAFWTREKGLIITAV